MPAQVPDTDSLIQLFFSSADALGRMERVGAVRSPYDQLLDHDQHMTVTVERFYGVTVRVEVLDVCERDSTYARKILLRKSSDDQVVQFGVVRLNLQYLTPAVSDLVRSETVPLGRVLIEHNVLRKVELVQLWDIQPSAELAGLLGNDEPTCGRTALIHVDEEPAVELLEIVSPVAET